MQHRSLGLFDQDTRYRKLEVLGDPLVVLNKIVPWEMFREPLEATRNEGRDPKRGGRPAYDAVLMFKILVLREVRVHGVPRSRPRADPLGRSERLQIVVASR